MKHVKPAENFFFATELAIGELLAGDFDGFGDFCFFTPGVDLVPCAFKVSDTHHYARAMAVLCNHDGTMCASCTLETVVERSSIFSERDHIFV